MVVMSLFRQATGLIYPLGGITLIGRTFLKRDDLLTLFVIIIFIQEVNLFNLANSIGITARYGILYKCNSFNITGRKNILPTKGL